MQRKWIGRVCGAARVALVLASGSLALPTPGAAQEVNEDYIVHHLGPAAEQMQAAGVDGSAESSPVIVGIGQQWLIEPAFWISVDEARMLVRAEREDSELRTRQASVTNPTAGYPARVVIARFGVVRTALTCQQAQQKARDAQRLADTLSRVSQLNGVGTGLVGALSQGATRFIAPMAFATVVTGFAAAWASQLATAYRNAPCWAGGERWQFRPKLLKASGFPGHFRIPLSLPWQPGLLHAALRTGITFRGHEAGSRFRYPLASGRWC